MSQDKVDSWRGRAPNRRPTQMSLVLEDEVVALRKSLGDLGTMIVGSSPEGGVITSTPRPSGTVLVHEADV
jgi:hypothetical protein